MSQQPIPIVPNTATNLGELVEEINLALRERREERDQAAVAAGRLWLAAMGLGGLGVGLFLGVLLGALIAK